MQHAKLSPSSSSRWLTCTASVEVSQQYENTTNDAASWGTTVHGIGEQLLLDQEVVVGDTIEGMVVDKEMLDCAEEYVDYCRSLMNPKSVVMVEERFDLSFIAPDTFGTGDFSVLNGEHLDIVDLKTGHNIVRAEENTQLQLYALGAIYELEDMGYTVDTVTLHIMQSRAGHIDTWDTTYDDLKAFEEFANEQAQLIFDGETKFNPNKKACEWCPHKVNCEALRTYTEQIVTGAFDNLEEIEGKADVIDANHIKRILDNADLIEGFLKAVKQVALERMQGGEEIKGYKLVESKTNRKWEDESKVEDYLKKKRVKVDEMYNRKLKPMTQLLKLRPKDKELAGMLIKPEGKPTIAPLSDKRPPLNAVCDSFEDLDGEL